jgi:branched-chain amino acid transport system substrate-binding protein
VTQARQLGYKGVFLGADGWSNIVGGDEDYASRRGPRGLLL